MVTIRDRIFITGSTSFLGKPLVHALFPSHPLRLLIHKTLPPSFFYHDSVHMISGDLTAITTEMLRDVSMVVHAAAITHGSPESYKRINVEGTAHLLSAASKAGVHRIVYISSRALGSACGSYGDSKARAEGLIEKSGIPFVIVRPAEVYDDAFSSPEGIGKLARLIKRFPIIPFPSHPHALLAPIHLDDVIAALVRIIENPLLSSTVYTLAGPETLTMKEIMKRTKNHFRLRRIFIPLPLPLFITTPSEQRARLVCKKESLSKNVMTDLALTPRLFLSPMIQ